MLLRAGSASGVDVLRSVCYCALWKAAFAIARCKEKPLALCLHPALVQSSVMSFAIRSRCANFVLQ